MPAEIEDWEQMEVLALYNNAFSGALPEGGTRMKRLKAMMLSFNDLSGTLPQGLGSMPTLRTLWLNGNRLEGALPTDMKDSAHWNAWRRSVVFQRGAGFR